MAAGWMVVSAGKRQSVSPDLHEARSSQGRAEVAWVRGAGMVHEPTNRSGTERGHLKQACVRVCMCVCALHSHMRIQYVTHARA